MIDCLRPYPAYKDSGVPWLGEVPEHWALVSIRRTFRATIRRDIRGDEVKMSMSRHLGLIPSDRLGSRSSVRSDSLSYSVCHPGDLVMNKYQAHAGLFGCAVTRGLITPNYTVFKASASARADYFARLFASTPYQTAFQMESYGVGDGMAPLYTGVFYRLPTVLPPIPEQSAIVRFLDHADRRIRRYIRAKQKLIKLLEEQKQAIIDRAVTRGLDPNVRLKPSGVEWLGEVPEHWAVLPARYLFRAVTRRKMNGDEVKLSVTQRQGLIPTDEMVENSTQALTFDRFQVCEPSDLVLNKYKAHLGVFWAASCRGLITPNYTVFKPSAGVITPFFELLFHTRTYRDAFAMTVYGVTEGMSPLYTQDFYATPLLSPPKAEQEHIVSWIVGRTATEDKAIARVEREISLLLEYRTRLIADVVTGKLDVREAAARLPEEEEPEESWEVEGLAEDEDGESLAEEG